MGINCANMYSTFGDKRALFEKAFGLYRKQVFSNAIKVINGDGSPIENVRSMVKCLEASMTKTECKGCLVSHTLIEFGHSNDPIAKRAKKLLDEVQAAFEKQLRAAKRSGELRDGLNPKDLAAMLVNTAQGLTVMARAGDSNEAYRGIIRSTLT